MRNPTNVIWNIFGPQFYRDQWLYADLMNSRIWYNDRGAGYLAEEHVCSIGLRYTNESGSPMGVFVTIEFYEQGGTDPIGRICTDPLDPDYDPLGNGSSIDRFKINFEDINEHIQTDGSVYVEDSESIYIGLDIGNFYSSAMSTALGMSSGVYDFIAYIGNNGTHDVIQSGKFARIFTFRDLNCYRLPHYRLTDQATVTWDVNDSVDVSGNGGLGREAFLEIDADRTFAPITNAVVGRRYELVVMSTVGNYYDLTFDSSYRMPDGHGGWEELGTISLYTDNDIASAAFEYNGPRTLKFEYDGTYFNVVNDTLPIAAFDGQEYILSFGESNNTWQEGVHNISFEGTGIVRISSSASSVTLPRVESEVSTDGVVTDQVDYTIANGEIRLTRIALRESDPDDPIRNLRFMRPDVDGTALPFDTKFHPLLINRLRNFGGIRSMDLQATNYSRVQHWGDRTMDNESKSVEFPNGNAPSLGVPVFDIVDLINEVSNDGSTKTLWICIPIYATDDFVNKYLQELYDNLNSNVNLIIEYSNEIWNGGFRQQDSAIELGNIAMSEGSQTTNLQFVAPNMIVSVDGDDLSAWYDNSIWKEITVTNSASNNGDYVISGISTTSSTNDTLELEELTIVNETNASAEVALRILDQSEWAIISAYAYHNYAIKRTMEVSDIAKSIWNSDLDRLHITYGMQWSGGRGDSVRYWLPYIDNTIIPRWNGDTNKIDSIAIAPYFGGEARADILKIRMTGLDATFNNGDIVTIQLSSGTEDRIVRHWLPNYIDDSGVTVGLLDTESMNDSRGSIAGTVTTGVTLTGDNITNAIVHDRDVAYNFGEDPDLADITSVYPSSGNQSNVTFDTTLNNNRVSYVNAYMQPVTLTLPASPSNGNTVLITDGSLNFHRSSATILPNSGQTVAGGASLVLDEKGAFKEFTYNSATSDWELTADTLYEDYMGTANGEQIDVDYVLDSVLELDFEILTYKFGWIKTIADSLGWGINCYEGGQHINATGSEKNSNFWNSAQQHYKWRDVMFDYLERTEGYIGTFALFMFISSDSHSAGYWGHLTANDIDQEVDELFDNPSSTLSDPTAVICPKYLGVVEYLTLLESDETGTDTGTNDENEINEIIYNDDQLLMSIFNPSNQPVNLTINSILYPHSQSTIPYKLSGNIQIKSNDGIIIEDNRINRGQIKQLQENIKLIINLR